MEKEFKCKHCGYESDNGCDFVATPIKEKEFICNECFENGEI